MKENDTSRAGGLAGATVVVTGGSRGLGLALASEAVTRGAARVVALSRTAPPAGSELEWVELDLADPVAIERATTEVGAVDVLVNNAGLGLPDWLESDAFLDAHLRTNLEGPRHLTERILPRLRERNGSIVNILSLASFAPIPGMASYSASKAAAMSWTQTLRIRERGRVAVHAVYAGPIDTDMIRDLPIPEKTPAAVVARTILTAISEGTPDVFPDPMAATFAASWATGPAVALEKANAALAAALA